MHPLHCGSSGDLRRKNKTPFVATFRSGLLKHGTRLFSIRATPAITADFSVGRQRQPYTGVCRYILHLTFGEAGSLPRHQARTPGGFAAQTDLFALAADR